MRYITPVIIVLYMPQFRGDLWRINSENTDVT